MKKILHILVFLIICHFSVSAQTTLFSDNFDSYTTSQKLAQQATGSWWTTWSGTPGSAEDAAISTTQAFSGSNSAKIVTNNDLVLLLGDKTTGRYQIKFQLFVTSNKGAFIGFMQDFNGSNTKFGASANFLLDTANLEAGGKTFEFDYPFNTWMLLNYIIDLDNDFATMYIDNKEIASWQWSKGSDGGGSLIKLDGIDFWGYDTENGCLNYIDDLEYIEQVALDFPTNLVSSMTNRAVSLNWDAPTTGTPDGYAILRNGIVIDTTSSLTYEDNTLIYPMDYTYTVKAHYIGLGYSGSTNETLETLSGESSQRKVLIEHFTNASCNPCASDNPILAALLNEGDNLSKVAHVAYHTSWPGTDPMYTFNNSNSLGNARVSYYKVTGVPDAVVAGSLFEGFPSGITQELIDSEYARPGLFNITSSVTIDENDSIFIELEYVPLTNFTSGNLKAHVILIEDMEYSSQAGTNGEKVFPDVMRYMYPDVNGTAIDLPSIGDTINLSFKGKLNSQLGDKLQLVTFIQNNVDHEVYMAYQLIDDFTAPTVIINPKHGAINVDLTTDIEITFTDSIRMIDDSEITDPSNLIVLKMDDENGSDVSVVASINSDKTKIILSPVSDFDAGQNYYVALEAGMVENYYNLPNSAASSTFTTKAALGLDDILNMRNVNIYPNPCVDKLSIELNLLEKTNVKIGIYNETGQLVKIVDKGTLSSGEHMLQLNLDRINSGFYFVQVSLDSESITQKIQIIK